MNTRQTTALKYVRNTAENVTLSEFYLAHAPIGLQLWDGLRAEGMVEINHDGAIALTTRGEKFLCRN